MSDTIAIPVIDTPPDLARKMVTLLNLGAGHTLLEPHAGKGSLLNAVLEYCALQSTNELPGVKDHWSRAATIARCFYCELHEPHREILKQLGYTNCLAEDFLTLDPATPIPNPSLHPSIPPGRQFDRILANPPFHRGLDLQHVVWMWSHLKPGGRCVTLTSPSWVDNDDDASCEFRDWVETCCIGDEDHDDQPPSMTNEEIPEGTFADTNIRTQLLVFTKDLKWPPPHCCYPEGERPLEPVQSAKPKVPIPQPTTTITATAPSVPSDTITPPVVRHLRRTDDPWASM